MGKNIHITCSLNVMIKSILTILINFFLYNDEVIKYDVILGYIWIHIVNIWY